MAKQRISIVIPTFNEAGNVELIYNAVVGSVPKNYVYEIIFVDDGSNDETLPTIKKLAHKHASVKYLSFTRNFGHQYALKAGIDHARGIATITMDADLEHPPRLIPKMLAAWEDGAKIVYTKRSDDPNLPLHKRLTSKFFYLMINKLSDTPILAGGADFRLIEELTDLLGIELQKRFMDSMNGAASVDKSFMRFSPISELREPCLSITFGEALP